MTGAAFDGEPHDAAHWWRNSREPVRFVDAMRAMIAGGYRVFLEVGPHPVLATNLRELLDESGAQGQTLHTLERDQPERLQVRRAVAALHCSGARVDWSALHEGGRQLSLPTYLWQRAVHWTETPAMRAERLATDYEHPFLQTRLPTPHPSWTAWLEGSAAAYLRDHRVQDVPIAPAAFYAEAGGGERLPRWARGSAAFAGARRAQRSPHDDGDSRGRQRSRPRARGVACSFTQLMSTPEAP